MQAMQAMQRQALPHCCSHTSTQFPLLSLPPYLGGHLTCSMDVGDESIGAFFVVFGYIHMIFVVQQERHLRVRTASLSKPPPLFFCHFVLETFVCAFFAGF